MPHKKREWPGLPERPGLGVRGDGPTPVPTPSFKRGRVEPISPTPREFDRSRPGGFFGGRGAPSGPGTSPNGMGLRRQPAGV